MADYSQMTHDINVHALVEKVAEALGAEWQARPDPTAWRANESHVIGRRDDQDCWFHLHLGHHHEGRLSVSGSYGQDGVKGLRYNEQRASITVSAAKTPQHIARELQRRFLPVYLEQYARNKTAVAADKAYVEQQQAVEARIRGAIKSYDAINPDPYRSRGAAIYLKHSTTSTVDLDLNGLAPALAEQVIALLTQAVLGAGETRVG